MLGFCAPEESPCGLLFPARAWLDRALLLALEIKETRVLLRRGFLGVVNWGGGEGFWGGRKMKSIKPVCFMKLMYINLVL